MATTSKYLSFFTILLFSCFIFPITFSKPFSDGDLDHPKTFIVHMEKSKKPSLFTSHHHWYNSIINSLPPSSNPSKILYTYQKVVNGFSASLTPSQATKLKDVPGVLDVTPDQVHEIQTTRTCQFLKLSTQYGLWPKGNFGQDVIVGVLDTGIWPEHPSFSDAEILTPVPSTWNGGCEVWSDFLDSSCNQKIIGARAFLSGNYMSNLGRSNVSVVTESPRDTNGHGTHVASTIAGAVVQSASFFEYAKGTAVGVAPKARIAVYKVCRTSHCSQADMLAGMDQAVADGVDIISMSIHGGRDAYYQDNIAIASFGAMRHGVLVSVIAGNYGPSPSTVYHLPPWVLTVGASSIDREFRADVVLGDSRFFIGSTLYAGTPLSYDQYPLVYAGDFGNIFCKNGGFYYPNQLAGKIIVCDDGGDITTFEKGNAVNNVGGVGLIIQNKEAFGEELQAEPHLMPGVRVSYNDGNEIKRYIQQSQNPTATILFRGEIVGPSTPPAPKVAAFSGRGPNYLTPQILKPDVIAPGLNILAAWSLGTGPWGDVDPRRVAFNIISGTSMACPHVSGIAALLRNVYPNWSPAAIKSALMTTAYDLDNSGQSIKDLSTGTDSTPLAHGAGHVDPNRALDPGLVYDMGVIDYIGFLCSVGYDYQKINKFFPVGPDICDQAYATLGAIVTPGDLNLPSFSVVFTSNVQTVKYRRIVTNVGSNVSAIYSVKYWSIPPGINVNVSPDNLAFSVNNPKQIYEIMFTSTGGFGNAERFGWFEWSDGTHRVRSVIAFFWVTTPVTVDSVASI